MRKPKYQPKKTVPFLRCLKCLEDTERWAALVDALDAVQRSSGGDSLRLLAELFKPETVVNAPQHAEQEEIAAAKEMESNKDIKARVK